jgi:hypothetical protein
MIYGYSKEMIQDAKADQTPNQALGRLSDLAINFLSDLCDNRVHEVITVCTNAICALC